MCLPQQAEGPLPNGKRAHTQVCPYADGPSPGSAIVPRPRRNVRIRMPLNRLPKAVRIVSPDWPGERPGQARLADGRLTVALPELEAYAVAILDYDELPELALAARRIVPARRWARPDRNEFTLQPDGTIREAWALNGYLQGRLHTHLRNPPTFLVHLPKGGSLEVHVRAVAMGGARLECLLDGKLHKAIDLPDRDRRNDGSAREYDATYTIPIPPGRHRLALRNPGADWATVAWYRLTGDTAKW